MTTCNVSMVIYASSQKLAVAQLNQPTVLDWSVADKEHLGEELSDVLINLVRLAEVCDVDLPSAVLRKMELNRKKYPASVVYGSSLKYNEYKEKEKKTLGN